jgi:hypothetical protein
VSNIKDWFICARCLQEKKQVNGCFFVKIGLGYMKCCSRCALLFRLYGYKPQTAEDFFTNPKLYLTFERICGII